MGKKLYIEILEFIIFSSLFNKHKVDGSFWKKMKSSNSEFVNQWVLWKLDVHDFDSRIV